MKKQDLIESLVLKTGLSKNEVDKVMRAFISETASILQKQGVMQITGLGRFKVNTRKGCINPKTKEVMKDKEVKYVSFTQSSRIKNKIND